MTDGRIEDAVGGIKFGLPSRVGPRVGVGIVSRMATSVLGGTLPQSFSPGSRLTGLSAHWGASKVRGQRLGRSRRSFAAVDVLFKYWRQ
jgi:hypothetical protein